MTRRSRPRPQRSLRDRIERLGDQATPPVLYDDRQEADRAAVLESLGLLDTAPEERFDAICRQARDVMQAPATYISLLDRDRQWFKSTLGMGEVTETPRDGTFCDYAVRRTQPTVVLDATADPLFAHSPYVVEGPKVRFYAGIPLVVEGQRVGTLCALDFQPRAEVTDEQMQEFQELAKSVQDQLQASSKPE